MYVLRPAKRTIKWRILRRMHLKTIKSLHLVQSSVLHDSIRSRRYDCSDGRPRTGSQVVAGDNDETREDCR